VILKGDIRRLLCEKPVSFSLSHQLYIERSKCMFLHYGTTYIDTIILRHYVILIGTSAFIDRILHVMLLQYLINRVLRAKITRYLCHTFLLIFRWTLDGSETIVTSLWANVYFYYKKSTTCFKKFKL